MALRERERQVEYLARYNAMGEMAMTIAHEISQPLSASRNFIEGASMRLAMNRDDAAPISFGLQQAARQIEHASLIVKSMREYAVKLEQAETLIDLNAVVRDSLYFISLKCADANVSMLLDLDTSPLPVSCEKVLIGQVIMNIALDALGEMGALDKERRSLRIETRATGDSVMVAIHDLGRRVPHAEGMRTFDFSFSGRNGIGLALCKSIVSRHRGDIWAQNREPFGTTFAFSLPLCQAHKKGRDCTDV